MGWFADLLWKEGDEQRAKRLVRQSESLSGSDRDQALALQAEAVEVLRRAVARGRPAYRAWLAQELVTLGKRQAQAGRRAEAVESTSEGGALFRLLASYNPSFRPHISDALYNLGFNYLSLQRYGDALGAFSETAEICRELKGSYRGWQENLAAALWNVANCQEALGQTRAAHSSSLETLAAYRDLVREDASAWSTMLADAFVVLSHREQRLGLLPDALQSASAALDLMQPADGSSEMTPRLAIGLSALGALQGGVGRPAEALVTTERAIAGLRELARENRRLTAYLGFSLANLASHRYELGMYALALEAGSEVVALERELVHAPAGEWRVSALATGLANVAFYQVALGRGEAALEASREALDLLREGRAQPAMTTDERVRILQSRVDSFDYVGSFEEGYRAAKEAVTLAREQVAGPDGSLVLAGALWCLAVAERARGLRAEAAASAAECLALYRELAAADPERFQRALAMCVNNVAAFEGDLGKHQPALVGATEAVAMYRRIYASNPGGTAINLCISLINLAERQSDLGDVEAVRESAAEAVALRRGLAETMPEAARPVLSEALWRLAHAHRLLGSTAEALDTATEAVAIARRLAGGNPGGFRRHLAKTVGEFSSVLEAAGRRGEALAAGEEAITIQRDLVAANRRGNLADLAASLYDMTAILGAAGRRDDALAAAKEGVALYEELASPYPEAFAGKLAAARERLAAL